MISVGTEWLIDAVGCDPELLRDVETLSRLCEQVLLDLDLHVVGTGNWHQFPLPGGVTGLYLLSESHLACHTYPEHGIATFNLYCCRVRPFPGCRWPWEQELSVRLGARQVTLRSLARGSEEALHPQSGSNDVRQGHLTRENCP